MKIERFHFKLKEAGFKKHINESAEIIGNSIYLVLKEDKKSFLKVIATQLRLLLCDGDNSLIQKCGVKDLRLSQLTSKELEVDIGTLKNPDMLFDHGKEKLPVDEWLNQIVVKMGIPILVVKEITCQSCDKQISVEKKHSEMTLDVFDGKSMIYYKCECTNKRREYDITEASGIEGNTFSITEEQIYTVRDVIKMYADKYGGAHVDPKLRFDVFFGVNIGERYILAIGNYILGRITEGNILVE